jgi:anti-sigma regulatory factor (Ser/Thr protein kinase)
VALSEQIEVRCEIGALAGLADWAEAFCRRRGASDDALFGLQLCLEEAVSNVIRHGGLSAEERIAVTLRVEGDALLVGIRDHGVAFDPLSVAAPAAPASLADAVIGGHGIALMRRFCRSAAYHRIEDENRLDLVIGLSGRPR